MPKGKLFLIVAPSGTGKTTLVNKVVDKLKNKIKIEKVKTVTTREKRPGEVDGVDYDFISKDDFIEKNKRNFFIEVTNYAGNYYGSPKNILKKMENGISFLLITDLKGITNFRDKKIPFKSICFLPPNLNQLETQLKYRKENNPKLIKERISLAKKELKECKKYKFDLILTNNNLTSSIDTVSNYILENS